MLIIYRMIELGHAHNNCGVQLQSKDAEARAEMCCNHRVESTCMLLCPCRNIRSARVICPLVYYASLLYIHLQIYSSL